MAKICVSSIELARMIRKTGDELSVSDIQGHYGILSLRDGGQVVNHASVMCNGPFSFKFSNYESFTEFRDLIKKVPEQPITLEDGDTLQMKCAFIFQ